MSSDQADVSAYLSVLWIFLSVWCAYLLWEYSNPKQVPWHTYPTVYIQYFCAFGIILLVPLDLSVTILARRSANNQDYYDNHIRTIINMYLSLYWPTLILSNILLVFQEQYNMDGYFTVFSRIINTFKQMSYQMIGGLIFSVIFFGILVGEHVIAADEGAVLLTGVLITNTIGLIFLMFLLGYGFVVFPQMLWGNGHLELRLLRAQQKAAMEFKTLGDTSLDISLCVSTVLRTKQELPRYADQQLNDAMEVLVNECPKDFTSSKLGEIAVDKKTQKVTIDALAALRQRLYWNKASYEMCMGRVERIQMLAYHLEDLVEAKNRRDGIKRIKWSFKPEGSEREYTWYIVVLPWLYRIASLLCASLSILSYLGVLGAMNGVPSDTSPYSLAVHSDKATGTGITVFVLFTLGYACFIASWSLFEMKLANIMELVTNQGTWPLSLSFNARMVARLSAPLAFFYLGWLHENQTKDLNSTNDVYTAFSRFYQIQVIPVMGNSFNTFFPILMLSVSFLQLTNVLNRIFVAIKCEDYQFGQTFISEEALREGKRQLSKRKKLVERQIRRHKVHSRLEGIYFATSEKIASIFSFNFRQKEEEEEQTLEEVEAGKPVELQTEPPVLEGIAEKKGGKSLGIVGSTNWQSRYFIVKKPSNLLYYKDKSMTQDPAGQVDLRLVMAFTIPENEKGEARLDLLLADKTFTMRFKTKEDAIHWRDGLMLWKDWAIDYATYFGDDALALEGEVSRAMSGGGKKDNVDYAAKLNAIKIDYDEDDEEDLTRPGTLSSSTNPLLGANTTPPKKESSFFNRNSGSSSTVPAASAPVAVAASRNQESKQASISSKPKRLDGWLEKKSPNKLAGWQRRFCKVDEATGLLHYYKSEDSSETSLGHIDLRTISDAVPFQKDGEKDVLRFNIEAGDKSYKMRTHSAADATRWIKGLNEWKDYVLLSM